MKVTKFEFALFGINTYVLTDEKTKECAIIDPGMMNKEEEEALAKFIEKEQLHVSHIINTHLHIDHIIGDQFAADRYGVPVFAHKDDEFLGSRATQQAASFGLPFKVNDVVVSEFLQDGDIIRIGDSELHVIHVPGHSPGSVALYDKKDGFVISGDALFQGSIGRTDLPGGDYAQLISAIKEKLLSLPDETVVYPGHGDASTIGYEKKHNPFLR